jgi:O-methyltransferase
MDGVFVNEWFDWQQRKPSKPLTLLNKVLGKLHFPYRILPPVYTGTHTNVERRMNIFHLVSQALCYGVPGDLVELGCNKGQTSVVIQKIIEHCGSDRILHVYDSFEGLPETTEGDVGTPFRGGWMKVSSDIVLDNFRRYSLRPPQIHAGWFEHTLPTELPDQICFAYLDGDFYESILISLQHVYPRLSSGAVCVVDDYCDSARSEWNFLPGVKRACDDFFADKPDRIESLYAGNSAQAYFRKL